ncbi:hypothetical protein [Stappia sp. WLB 29]|uniref:hypothetical protein n=1 Tax=Stappia sp. WLB 29 TaxID=2925220 RepID=UPI0020BE21F9|nr:hypothetical protein [Stappia sp. WLB 29]
MAGSKAPADGAAQSPEQAEAADPETAGAKTRKPPPTHAASPDRKAPVHLGVEAWAEARQLYESGALDADGVVKRFCVAKSTVLRHIQAEGWVRSGDVRGLIAAGDTQGLACLVGRLAEAFERQVEAIELEIGRSRALKLDRAEASQLAERNARTLGILARTLDVLVELRSGVRELDPAGRDEDALRHELAQRLDRLCGEGAVAGLSGAADGGGTALPAP